MGNDIFETTRDSALPATVKCSEPTRGGVGGDPARLCSVPILEVKRSSSGTFSIVYSYQRGNSIALENASVPNKSKFAELLAQEKIKRGDIVTMLAVQDSDSFLSAPISFASSLSAVEKPMHPEKRETERTALLRKISAQPEDKVEKLGNKLFYGGLLAVCLIGMPMLIAPAAVAASDIYFGVVIFGGVAALASTGIGMLLGNKASEWRNASTEIPRSDVQTRRILRRME